MTLYLVTDWYINTVKQPPAVYQVGSKKKRADSFTSITTRFFGTVRKVFLEQGKLNGFTKQAHY
jgi:hypothetical protein